jgi:L-cysteate sulfo-lyase
MKPETVRTSVEHRSLQKLTEIPFVSILFGETPITRIPGPLQVAKTKDLRIDYAVDSPVFIKRDDLTPGFGNKTRKLELLLADAQAKTADCVITAGGPQSNHCRQTAQFARSIDIDVHLVIGTRTGERDFPFAGNQVVDRLFGAEISVCKKGEHAEAMKSIAGSLQKTGRTPYIIPVGGSNYLGALAYAKGFLELLEQCVRSGDSFDRIVLATSSGGTQAGLVVGATLANWDGEILGISIDQVPDSDEPNETSRYVKHMVSIANDALDYLDSRLRLSGADFNVNYNYLQSGYGVVGDYDRIGVRTLANHGIISGPVYSGRAFGALVDLIARGEIPADGKTLFWHTGGAGELDFYKDDLFQST